ncbi:MAG: hypothetical protein U0802_17950 [Candidatus Binatia bacterium]
MQQLLRQNAEQQRQIQQLQQQVESLQSAPRAAATPSPIAAAAPAA